MATYYRITLRNKKGEAIYPQIDHNIEIDNSGNIKLKGGKLIGLAEKAKQDENGNNIIDTYVNVNNNQTINGEKTFNDIVNFNSNIYFKTSPTLCGNTSTSLYAKLDSYTGTIIQVKNGGQNGHNLLIDGGCNTVIGSGESAQKIYNNMLVNSDSKKMFITSEGEINFYTNCQTIENKKLALTINTDGTLTSDYNLLTAGVGTFSSKSTYNLTMGGGDSYCWIDCRQTSDNTTKSNIMLFPNSINLEKDTLINGNLTFPNSGTSFRGIIGTSGDNDQWYIGGGATGSNAGYMLIATGDDGTEPIYVRQYINGAPPDSGQIARTLTLLDENGNSNFPGVLQSTGVGIFSECQISSRTINASFMNQFRTQTKGDSSHGGYITSIRNDTGTSQSNRYGTGIAFGRADTHGYIYMPYESAHVYVGAGNEDKLNWMRPLIVNADGVDFLRAGTIAQWDSNYSSFDVGTVMFCW